MATITLKGNPIETAGNLPAIGSQAPAFTLTRTDLSNCSQDDLPQDHRPQHLSQYRHVGLRRLGAPFQCRGHSPEGHGRPLHLRRPALRPQAILRGGRPGQRHPAVGLSRPPPSAPTTA